MRAFNDDLGSAKLITLVFLKLVEIRCGEGLGGFRMEVLANSNAPLAHPPFRTSGVEPLPPFKAHSLDSPHTTQQFFSSASPS